MKSLDYARILLPAGILMLAGCDSTSNFTGQGVAGGGGGGLGGGGGGGSGGGTTVTVEPVMQYGPNQSPGFGGVVISGNASKIVFVDDANPLGTNPNEEWQLFAWDINSMNVAQITDGSATAVPFLFDYDITDSGDSVVWASSDDFVGTNPNMQFNIFKASTSGGGISQVTSIDAGFASNPKISANGNVVVFLSDNDLTGDNPTMDTQIFSINADGSNLTQVTNIRLVPANMAFSDDGSTIAFEGIGDPFGMNADGSWEIFVIDISGLNLTQLTMTDGNSFAPKISDDGTKVVFTSQADHTGGNTDGTYEVFAANSDGSGIVQLSDGDRDSGTFQSGAPGSFDISGNGSFALFASEANLAGENPQLQHTIFWTATTGEIVVQVLRDGTVAGAGIDNRTADQPSLTNDGIGMAFESSVNLTADTQPGFDKIYTTVITQ